MKYPHQSKRKSLCILGLGYIGLPTAALLANRGYNVIGVDVNSSVVDTINRGDIHIEEPDLDTFVRAAVDSGRFKAAVYPTTADVYIIAVPTPFKGKNEPDVSYVESAAVQIAPFVRPGNLVILESTSPVGTTERVARILEDHGVNTDEVLIAHCPERVLPGKIMVELTENDRVVGGLTKEAAQGVAAFYRTFVNGEVLETDARTAELTKLVENSSRDLEIAFANELSMVCHALDIDVWDVITLANRHPRVNILNPGVGVGGHCIAVDPWFIVSSAPNESKLIQAARNRNLEKTKWVAQQVAAEAASLQLKLNRRPIIACMGLAYKANVDDLRESPALEIAHDLRQLGYDLLVSEPHISSHPDFELFEPQMAVDGADLVVYLVGHRDFANLVVSHKPIMDYCGITRE
jgi:UDP-N-acetyl-D-mannosaminuronic acid dehydrogenase